MTRLRLDNLVLLPIGLALSGAATGLPIETPNEGSSVISNSRHRWCRDSEHGASGEFNVRSFKACEAWLQHTVALGPAEMDVGYLWVLQRLLRESPDRAIENLISSWEPHFRRLGRGAIVYPAIPRRPLPDDPGSGLRKFRNWVSAASGRPSHRAIRFIDSFTSQPDAIGYVLTHQILVIEWAADAGLELPERIRQRRPALLERLEREHDSDPRPGDLYFERLFLLLLYGDIEVDQAKRWVGQMLGGWDESEMRWKFESREAIHFDGKQYRFKHGSHHPTAVALGAIQTYLARFGRETSGKKKWNTE